MKTSIPSKKSPVGIIIFSLICLFIALFAASQDNTNPEFVELSSTETSFTTQVLPVKNTQKPVKPAVESHPKTPVPTQQPPVPVQVPQNISGMGQAFNNTLISLVNQERLKAGLDVLTPNSALNRAAQLKVEDMVKNNYFAHTSPSGRTADSIRFEAGYDSALDGENLAVLFKTAPEIIAAWMNSATHKANILQTVYRDVGVATAFTVYKGQNTFFVAMEFGSGS